MLTSEASTGKQGPDTNLPPALPLSPPHTLLDYPLVAVAWRGGCAQELAAEVPAGSTGKAEQRVSHHLAKPLCESQLSSVCSLQGQEGRFLMTSTLVP